MHDHKHESSQGKTNRVLKDVIIRTETPEAPVREFSFQNGLRAAMQEDRCPSRDLRYGVTTMGEYLFFSFLLKGRTVGTCDGMFRDRPFSAGFGGCWYTPDRHGKVGAPAGEPLHRMSISMSREFIDNRLGGTDSPGFPKALQTALEQNRTGCYHRPFPITPWMRSLIHRLAHNPFEGPLGKLYAESQVLEILVLAMGAIGGGNDKEYDVRLSSRDVELVHKAGEILVQRMDDPPSVLALARMVGLSETKLKKGFRAIFDSTVFGYLRKQRMMQARDLLSGGNVTVCQAASTVGYVNASHFSKTFMDTFGVLPGAYLGESKDRAAAARKHTARI